MLKLKLQYFGHLVRRTDSLEKWEKLDAGKDRRWEEKWMTGDVMVGWHHWFNGQEFEQALGDGEQGSLACCSPGIAESDRTEQLNKNRNTGGQCQIISMRWTKYLSLTVRQRGRVLWGRPLCLIIITATKASQRNSFQHGIRIGPSLQQVDRDPWLLEIFT